MKLSIVINADTRSGFQNESSQASGLFNGCTSEDFLIDGIKNKIAFFHGFDKEIILHIDKHEEIPIPIEGKLRQLCDIVLIRPHTNEESFNDWNYHRALSLATGDIVVHFDQDTAAFTSGKEYIEELISYLDNYKFVSYPSHWSPRAITDNSFGNRTWASTRFFMCRRESLRLHDLAHCICEPEWAYATFGDSPRRVNWTEHYLSLINNDSVYYPPVQMHKGMIFSWSAYKKGTLSALNSVGYEEVKQWVLHRGGIQYPVDVKCE